MTEAEERQRRIRLAQCGGFCEVCGRPLKEGQPQGAHRIANTKANRAKFGSLIIDHPLNIMMTCSLNCNHACNIGQNPGASLKLCKEIIEYELRKFPEAK